MSKKKKLDSNIRKTFVFENKMLSFNYKINDVFSLITKKRIKPPSDKDDDKQQPKAST